ncbi:MAG: acyl carrier protein [Rhodospirillaceae bacterium]|nr:acyl carrier protein [Rhodospirillaceae bacterium]MDE0616481.1 acyl carrier protein [Rhodospirillaceae bacterium]MXY41622.1 acyl carrier protein [Rhodospirillaceae bacterium]MYF87241.1 acyl carrier protein [Rhodospirillaceae bacterium]MYH38959.1 acyl carrier protein [Rhodospirillaceae bacterium]
MSATQDRVRALFREHLDADRDPDFGVGLGDSGISSMDAVKFVKACGEAFGVEMRAEDVADFQTLGDVVTYLDANAG